MVPNVLDGHTPMVVRCVPALIANPMATAHGLAIQFASNDNMAHPESPTSLLTADIGPFLLPFGTLELVSVLDSPSFRTSEMVKQITMGYWKFFFIISYLGSQAVDL